MFFLPLIRNYPLSTPPGATFLHGCSPFKGEVFEETNGETKYKIVLAKTPHDSTSSDFAKITVPEHCCFVLGDNRNLSLDSRRFGSIPLATIIGRADYLYFPAKDWSRFDRMKSKKCD